MFERFGGKGQDARRANGIHAQPVAEVVHACDGVQVVDQQVAAKAAQRLVFGAFAAHARVRPFRDLDRLATADGTGIAEGVADPDPVVHGLPGNRLSPVGPAALLPVLEWQTAKTLGGEHAAARAEQSHAGSLGPDHLVEALDERPQRVCVGVPGLGRAAYGDRLEHFRAHHGAHTRPSSSARVHRTALHDRGIAHPALARRSDAGDLCPGVGFSTDLFVCRKLIQPPQVSGVPQLCRLFPPVDPQVDGVVCAAFQDQSIITGKAQFGAPVSARVGLAPDSGEGRSRTPRAPAAGGRDRAREQPVERIERVRRVERIVRHPPCRQRVVEHLRRQPAPEQHRAHGLGIDRHVGDLTAFQADP